MARRVNDSKFGLQAGVFTHDMDKAFYAFEHLEVIWAAHLRHLLSVFQCCSNVAISANVPWPCSSVNGCSCCKALRGSADCRQVGGVVLGNVPSIRVDSQPYGGVKDSGLGREGIRYAMKDMTEERVLLMADVGTGFSE